MKIEILDPDVKPPAVPWGEVAKFAKAHPGEWVSPKRHLSAGYVTAINGASMSAFRPKGKWEARTIFGRVAVRYIGKKQAMERWKAEKRAEGLRLKKARRRG